MSASRIRPAVPKGSAVQPGVVVPTDRVMNLEDVAEYLRCSTEEAMQFVDENDLTGVEFPSGPRYLLADVFAAFTASLARSQAKKLETQKNDEVQGLWVAWLNKVQPLLTPVEQDAWVKFARFLMTRRVPPAEFFRRQPEDRQTFVKASGIDFKLRDNYGNAHIGLEPVKGSGSKPALAGARTSSPTSRGSKPFGS